MQVSATNYGVVARIFNEVNSFVNSLASLVMVWLIYHMVYVKKTTKFTEVDKHTSTTHTHEKICSLSHSIHTHTTHTFSSSIWLPLWPFSKPRTT